MKVRQAKSRELRNWLRFNSRTCEGATKGMEENISFEDVSIHAPVKVRHERELFKIDL